MCLPSQKYACRKKTAMAYHSTVYYTLKGGHVWHLDKHTYPDSCQNLCAFI